jgi:hypothetical protein
VKLAFIVGNEFVMPQVMELLRASGIDYYTRWNHAQGKGHGTDPHLGSGSFGSTNSVLMIAFEAQTPLDTLISAIVTLNGHIKRADERIRLFQVPLELIV